MVITVSIASYHYIFEFVRNREPSFGFTRKGPWNAPPHPHPRPTGGRRVSPSDVFKGARPALAKSGLLSRGLGGRHWAPQVRPSPLGVPGCAHRSGTPSFEHRACLAGQPGGSVVGGIQDGRAPSSWARSARTRTRCWPLPREECVSEGLGDPASSPPSAGLVGTRTSPKRHRPCFLMFWGQRGRKSNNCLRAKTMDLLYEIFIFRADPGPVGWDLGARVSG